MPDDYRHLGEYSDLVSAARRKQPLYPVAPPGSQTQALIRDVLGFHQADESPSDVRVEAEWEKDGLAGQEVSWSVGYGPRTHAFVLKPAGVVGPLPGIIALHDHSDFKYYGKEKIADGPLGPLPVLNNLRQDMYGGRAYANALAREGFVVLVHDVFLWGSRRFPYDTMLEMMGPQTSVIFQADFDSINDVERYNLASNFHEHWVSKYCTMGVSKTVGSRNP